MDTPRTPRRLGWSEAPREVLIAAARLARPVVAIGITGPVGAGKSTLAGMLSSCIVRTDDYLPDYELIPYAERDQPRHADLARLASDLAALRAGRTVRAPVWSFHTHRREGERAVEPAAIVVCEGIHALEAAPAAHLDIRIFVDAPAPVRWGRWEDLERRGVRGWGVDAAREYFDHVAEPTFAASQARYRDAAHMIVTNDQGGEKQPSQRGS
jgi:uridine kinase